MKTRFELRVNDSALQIGIGRLKKINWKVRKYMSVLKLQ
jgi:hypothetical protein